MSNELILNRLGTAAASHRGQAPPPPPLRLSQQERQQLAQEELRVVEYASFLADDNYDHTIGVRSLMDMQNESADTLAFAAAAARPL